MYVFPFLPLNNRIVRKNASGILPKGGSSHSDEHVSEEMRVVLSQLRTKFLNPADDWGEIGLVCNRTVVDFSHNHYHEVGIGEKVELVEGLLWNVGLCEDLKESVDLIWHFDVDKVKDFSDELVDGGSVLFLHYFFHESATNFFIFAYKIAPFLSVYFCLIPQHQFDNLPFVVFPK